MWLRLHNISLAAITSFNLLLLNKVAVGDCVQNAYPYIQILRKPINNRA